MAAQQVLKNTRGTLEITFSAGVADGTVTVTVTKADGTSFMSGSATHGTGGAYTFALNPATELDYLTVTWAGAWSGIAQSITTYAEIVGGYLFTIADARAFGDKALADATAYPDEAIRETRERITDFFQQICGVSFIPRFARDTVDGVGSYSIWVWQTSVNRVISATVDGIALTSGQLADVVVRPSGMLFWKTGAWNWAFGGRNVVISYEHGYTTVPAAIQRAALVLARYELVSNDISDRMIAFDNDLGSVRLSVPGLNYPTGIPIVDATLARYDLTPLLIA